MINNKILLSGSKQDPYYAVVRKPLLELLTRVPERVLEIGCGEGLMLEYLKAHGARYAAGIELREDVAIRARDRRVIDDVKMMDIESEPAPYPDGAFDLIIMSHVLEHLIRPQAVLEKVLPMLSRAGEVLVAVPNVRHLSVVLPLVFSGEFKYEPSGIMDHTHLRFYTSKSIERLLEDCGLNVQKVHLEIMGPKSRALNVASLGLLRPFAAYAVNVLASRR